MSKPSYTMDKCPECKTLSIPANDVCLNCNVRWITKTVYNISGNLSFMDKVMLIFCGVAIVLFIILLLDHYGLLKILKGI